MVELQPPLPVSPGLPVEAPPGAGSGATSPGRFWKGHNNPFAFKTTVDSKSIGIGPTMIYAGFPSPLGLEDGHEPSFWRLL